VRKVTLAGFSKEGEMRQALLVALLLLGVVEMEFYAAMVDTTESADVTKMDGPTEQPPKP
jgi:hypothetical protein